MEEIHVWRSTRDAEAWVFYFEKCKLFRMKHESNLPNNYIALRCHRHPASKSLRSANKESFTCPFKIIVQGKLTSEPEYVFTGQHDHNVTEKVFYKERFKDSLMAAIARDKTASFEALYKMVQVETGIPKIHLDSVSAMKKAYKRKKDNASKTISKPPRDAPYIPPRDGSRETRVDLEEEDTAEDDESMEVVEVEQEGPPEDQQPKIANGDNIITEAVVQEREVAGTVEGPLVVHEEAANGAVTKDIVVPKVPHYWEPRTPKERPVCRVKPMPRPKVAVRRPPPPIVLPLPRVPPLFVPPTIVLD